MESTLSLQVSDLQGEVGFFLGYGRGAPNGEALWTTLQLNAIQSIVKSGLRNFYFPPPVEGQESSYVWSFMKPRATSDFPAGAQFVPLPDDFGGFEGQITLQALTSQLWWPLDIRNEGDVAQYYSETPTATGRPWMAALQWLKGTAGTQGQRAQLWLFPKADTDYTLGFQYYLLPDYLDGSFPFPYGGMQHAETILESCLAVAEQRLDDATSVHTMKFNERLMASISADRVNKPQLGGYNADRSDMMDRWGRTVWNHYNDRILVNGKAY